MPTAQHKGDRSSTARSRRNMRVHRFRYSATIRVVEIWSHGSKLYEVNSMYSLPDDAWMYELIGLTGPPRTGPYLAITIPDANPDAGPFIPRPAQDAAVHVSSGQAPWPILDRFLSLVLSSGDLVEEQPALSAEDTALPATLNVWHHGDKQFEVNHFHFGDNDTWCYELYEVKSPVATNDYIDIQIPDIQPEGGPFVPDHADRVTLTIHGEWTVPWPVFRRFLAAVRAAGHIVGTGS
jgi:hypothetical protein